jgi:multimeric flavodoxin WrbA
VKVIAFNGSPRPGGNTEVLMNEALKPLREAGHEITVFELNKIVIKPCQDCGGCTKTGICIHKNDAMCGIYDAIREAERIILSSPIFFSSVSAQTKAMIDRCQAFWCDKYLNKKEIPAGPRGRKGLLLLVGGMKKEGSQACAEETSKAFFRTVSVPSHRTLFYLGVDVKGDIQKHPTALKEAYQAGAELGREN